MSFTRIARRLTVPFLVAAAVAGLAAVTATAKTKHPKQPKPTTPPARFNALVAAAKKEGTVTFYTPLNVTQVNPWVAPFTKKYGVQVQVVSEPSSTIGQQFSTMNEAGNNQIDVMQSSNWQQIGGFATAGLLAKYVPEAAGQYVGASKIPGYAYDLGVAQGGIAWNTQCTPPDVQKELEADPFKGLLDPALKGKIVLPDPAAGGTGLSYYAYLLYGPGKAKYGQSYLNQLGQQSPAFAPAVATIAAEVEQCAYEATMFGDVSIFGTAAAQGAPVQFASLPTMNGSQFLLAIAKSAPHPNAARLFEEWSQTKGAQELMTLYTGQASALNGWKENRPFQKLPWYKPPKSLWFEWEHDSRLGGNNLGTFITQLNSTLKH